VKPYTVVVAGPAILFLRRCPRSVFAEVELLFARLEHAPHEPPDLTEKSDEARQLSLRFLKRCAVSYWLDDAVREIRVVRIEPLGR
jgi:hypothetical protein